MPSKKKPTTNDVFDKYARKRAKVTVQKLNKELILIEGDRTAFEFLGELFFAYARSREHMVQFWPKGPGNARFTSQSTVGFYLHMLPCALRKGKLGQLAVQRAIGNRERRPPH